MRSIYEPLRLIEARVLGFAMAVKDLKEMGHPMSQEAMTNALIAYVEEYQLLKEKINQTVN